VLQGCQRSGAKRVRVHILLDGRDVPDGSSVVDTQELEKVRANRQQDAHGLL
jgi:2,3-bisphosphoglycerate-independent phosphoglycerate mutase